VGPRQCSGDDVRTFDAVLKRYDGRAFARDRPQCFRRLLRVAELCREDDDLRWFCRGGIAYGLGGLYADVAVGAQNLEPVTTDRFEVRPSGDERHVLSGSG
jgi:hypothetical protein